MPSTLMSKWGRQQRTVRLHCGRCGRWWGRQTRWMMALRPVVTLLAPCMLKEAIQRSHSARTCTPKAAAHAVAASAARLRGAAAHGCAVAAAGAAHRRDDAAIGLLIAAVDRKLVVVLVLHAHNLLTSGEGWVVGVAGM